MQLSSTNAKQASVSASANSYYHSESKFLLFFSYFFLFIFFLIEKANIVAMSMSPHARSASSNTIATASRELVQRIRDILVSPRSADYMSCKHFFFKKKSQISIEYALAAARAIST